MQPRHQSDRVPSVGRSRRSLDLPWPSSCGPTAGKCPANKMQKSPGLVDPEAAPHMLGTHAPGAARNTNAFRKLGRWSISRIWSTLILRVSCHAASLQRGIAVCKPT
eukprot:Skav233281  [mRNA]  locus=scaffold114:70032:73146:+ [translate_table: standard]